MKTDSNQLHDLVENLGSQGSRPKFGQDNTVRRSLHLYLYYVNALYDEKEEYVIYDTNSFIADVGGYMGLLLGFSLQSMAEMVESWVNKLGGKMFLVSFLS